MSFCCSIFDTQRVRYGFGRHEEYVQSTFTETAMYDVLVELLNVLATLCIKVSICLLVRRIIRGTHRKLRVVLWVIIAFLMALTLTTCVAFGLKCQPFRKTWNSAVPGRCFFNLNLGLLMRILCGKSPCDPDHIIQVTDTSLLTGIKSSGSGDRLCLRHYSNFRDPWASAE